MATKLNDAAIMRRGSEALSVNAAVALAENPDALKEVCAEIDGRAATARERERFTAAAADAPAITNTLTMIARFAAEDMLKIPFMASVIP